MVIRYNVELDSEKHPTLVKESSHDYEANNLINAKKVVDMLNACFHLNKLSEEHLYMISFDGKYNVLGVFEISHGDAIQSFAGGREIFQRALLSGAVYMILAHNHPSEDVTPSKSDKEVYDKIKSAGKIMGINLSDFIIVGGDNYYSYQGE